MAHLREEPEAGEEAAATGPRLPEVVGCGREEEAWGGRQGFRKPQGREAHEALARRPPQDGGGRRERQDREAVRERPGQDRVRVIEGPRPPARRESRRRLPERAAVDRRAFVRTLGGGQGRGP